MDPLQLAALDGRKTIARRSLDRASTSHHLGPPSAGGKPRPRPPSRKSSRDTVRRLSNLGEKQHSLEWEDLPSSCLHPVWDQPHYIMLCSFNLH